MLVEVWSEHPPEAIMRRKQASSPDSPSMLMRWRVELAESMVVEFVSVSVVELELVVGFVSVSVVELELVVEFVSVSVLELVAEFVSVSVVELVADNAISSGSRATTLQTLLSKRTSTFGNASLPSAQLFLTNSGIGHSGMFDLHSCDWELVPLGHRPLKNRSASPPRQYGLECRPPYKKYPAAMVTAAPTAAPATTFLIVLP